MSMTFDDRRCLPTLDPRPSAGAWVMILLLVALMVMPVAAATVGAGGAGKLAFPVLVALFALRLAAVDPPGYLRLLLWTFILAPGLRHYVDWHVGFSQSNPIMLAPYLAVMAATPSVLLHLVTLRRYAVPGLVLIGLIMLGVGISLATGQVQPPLMAAMRWLCPLWVAYYVIAHAGRDLPAMRAAVLGTFRLAVPVIAVYGIIQFVAVSPWDEAFMRFAPYTAVASFGYPIPFGVRVFGTMNSPGSVAAMLGTGILLLLPRARGAAWIGILLGFMTLFLTTQRAALGGFVIGTVVAALVTRDPRLRRGLGRMVMVLTIAGGVLLTIPGAQMKLETTFSSFSKLDQDDSAQERWKQYEDFLPRLGNHVLGSGLAWSENDAYKIAGIPISLDSGLIDTITALGVPGGVLYLAILCGLALRALRIAAQSSDSAAGAEAAGVMFGLSQLPLGSQNTGEHGMFLFLALGLVLARGAAAPFPVAGRPGVAQVSEVTSRR